MNSTFRHLSILSLLILLGCSKAPQEELNPPIITVREADLDVEQTPELFVWMSKKKLSDPKHLASVKELRVVSKKLDQYSFNEVDLYLDPYTKEGVSGYPFVQVTLPTPLLEKGTGFTRIALPGKQILKKLDLLSSLLTVKKYHSIHLRILFTNHTTPENPIQIALIIPVLNLPDIEVDTHPQPQAY